MYAPRGSRCLKERADNGSDDKITSVGVAALGSLRCENARIKTGKSAPSGKHSKSLNLTSLACSGGWVGGCV